MEGTDWGALKAIQSSGAEMVVQDDMIQYDAIAHVTGMDIQFGSPGEDNGVCVAARLPFPNTSGKRSYFVHHHSTSVPYKAGFLGFREVEGYIQLVKMMQAAGCKPQCIIVDGNGILHPRKFGSASQLGVATGIMTIGVAKQLHCCCGGWTEQGVRQEMMSGNLLELDLADNKGYVLARAIRLNIQSNRPVYVSVGHGISLNTACRVVRQCMRFRVPEPVRAADQHARRIAATLC